jgi:release factor family 3
VEGSQNRIRLKNLLREAEGQLLARGEKRPGDLLMPGLALVDDTAFWAHPSDGLALFISPGLTWHYHLPQPFPELAVVGDRFHLAPLLPLVDPDGHFHLLALSQHHVRLFLAGPDGLDEVTPRGVPRSVQAALHYDESEHVVDDDAKEQVRRFIEVLADALEPVWQQRKPPLPLVVAGVEYERAMFRATSKHPRIIEPGVDGSPDSLSDEELLGRARPLVEPALHDAERHAATLFQDLGGTARASTDLEEVLLAAADGRVDKLFFDAREQRWGRFDAEARAVEVHRDRQPGDEELVDRAAVETVFHGGCVYPVGTGDGAMAVGPVAAVLRY